MNDLSENRGKAKEAAKEGMQNVADKVADTTKELKDQMNQYSENVTEYIKKCPIKSVAIASVAGVVLGLLMKK